jgi:8-oxo-dGTP pyrophosphatase MutT (NUDIX family)
MGRDQDEPVLDEPPTRFSLVAAVHLFLVRDGEVLLLRRYGTGYEDGNYSVIAGHLDGEEQVKDAAIREAREEAGVEIRAEDLEVVGVMHRRGEPGRAGDERVDFFVAASGWSGEISNREPHKCDDLSWFRLNALPDNVIPYVGRALENYGRGVWFDSFGWEEGSRDV